MGAAAAYVNRATFFAPSLTLFDAAPPANDTKPTARVVPEFKWIHCANEGIYKGHHQGEFDLTRATFEEFVRNFRDDPQYAAGKLEFSGQTYTGGVQPVIQFDYEHASEMPPWEGSIATSGAPACGWVLDVAIRAGADGKAQLWAFGKLGELIRGQIQRDEYRSVSIAFTLQGVHWVSGEPIGAVLTSIAFTNHPFMRDLEPLAAANRRTSAPPGSRVKPPGSSSEAPDGNSQPTGAQIMSEQFRERVCKALNIRAAADDAAVGEAVEQAVSAAGDLKGLLEALGVSKPDEAMKTIPELRSAREKLAGLLSELDALLQQDAAIDAEVSKVDVGAAMKARNFQGDGASKALGAFRSQLIAAEVTKVQASKKQGEQVTLSELRAARKAGREHFLTEYGVKDADKLYLTGTFVAAPDGTQVQPPPPPRPLQEDREQGPLSIDLRGLKGRNVTEKLITHLSKNEPGFDKLPLERKISRAGEVRRTAEITLQ